MRRDAPDEPHTVAGTVEGIPVLVHLPASRRAVMVYRSRSKIRILTAEASDAMDGGDVVPGWKLPVAELFAKSRTSR